MKKAKTIKCLKHGEHIYFHIVVDLSGGKVKICAICAKENGKKI